MGKLLAFEFRKLFRLKSFYICTGITLLMGILTLRAFSHGGAGYDGFVSLLKAVDNSSLTMLLGIWTAIFICDDYTAGTIRNIVTRGYTRTSIFFSKLIVLCCGTLIMLVLDWIVSCIAGEAMWGKAQTVLSIGFMKSLMAQLMLVIAYACLCNAIASAVQKTGVAVAICAVMPVAVFLLLSFIEITLANRGNSIGAMSLEQYWLNDMISAVSFPDAPAEDISRAFKASVCYIAATSVLGWFSIARKEY